MSGYYSEHSDTDSDNDSNSDSEIETQTKNQVLFNKIPGIIKGGNIAVPDDDVDIDDADVSDDSDGDVSEEDDGEEKIGGQISDQEDADESDDDEDSEDEAKVNEDGDIIEKVPLIKTNGKPKRIPIVTQYDDDEDDDDEYEENYLQKFDNEIIKNYVNEFHPECLNHNYEEIAKMSIVIRNSDGIIIDPLHKTIPYLTKYEKARILGQRSKQIETGAKPLVKVPENIVDGYIIAELELKEKKIPFIIRRPIPGGSCEYWHLRDLENVGF